MADGATARSEAEDRVDDLAVVQLVHPASVGLFFLGLLLTVVLALSSYSAYRTNEDRLLEQRSREAAAVLTAAISTVETPVSSSAELVAANDGDESSFRTFMTPFVGEGRRFESASIWRRGEEELGPILVVGEDPILAGLPPEVARDFFERTVEEPSLKVLDLLGEEGPHLGYSWASPATRGELVVYIEQALPESRTSVPQPDSAFADLDYALYIGGGQEPDQLIFASTSDLPLEGPTASETVPIGDTDLQLVVSPMANLGGDLLRYLPWLILGAGALISLGFALLHERQLRRRDHAEKLVGELARVAEDNARLYGEQRSVAQTLQQSLLLQSLPELDGLDLAVRYEPGVAGVDIGGDWYDVIPVEEGNVVMVVGDVSGRGVRAATVMAALRYSIRAYAAQGDGPAAILSNLGEVISIEQDGHFATVLVGEIDRARGTVTIANAGHPSPLLIDDAGARFVDTEIGVPVGVATNATYETVTISLAPGSLLLAFTDGLFERRGETVDVGLERLRASVAPWDTDLEVVLDRIIDDVAGTSEDDAAILGIRWMRPTTPPPTSQQMRRPTTQGGR